MSVSQLVLEARTPRQVTEARRALRRQLERWHCDRADDGLLVFSELVTNAVHHAGGADQVTVIHGEQMLRIEVRDHSPAVPRERRTGDTTGGFGLGLVRQLSQRWGWEPTADGKVVWSDVPCCRDSTT